MYLVLATQSATLKSLKHKFRVEAVKCNQTVESLNDIWNNSEIAKSVNIFPVKFCYRSLIESYNKQSPEGSLMIQHSLHTVQESTGRSEFTELNAECVWVVLIQTKLEEECEKLQTELNRAKIQAGSTEDFFSNSLSK